MNRPTDVDVLIRSHGDSAYIEGAIKSVLDQEFDGEILCHVSLYNPSPRVISIVEKMGIDKRVCIHRVHRAGYAAPLNLMLACNSAPYVAILDHDDRMLINRIQRQYHFLEKNLQMSVVGSAIRLIDANGFAIGIKTYESDSKRIQETKYVKSPVANPAVMMRRVHVDRAGGFRSFYDTVEDYDLWLRVLEFGSIGNIPGILTEYRIHESQITQTDRRRNLIATVATIESSKRRRKNLPEIHELHLDIDEYYRIFHVRFKVGYRFSVESLIRGIRYTYKKGNWALALFYFLVLTTLSPRQSRWIFQVAVKKVSKWN